MADLQAQLDALSKAKKEVINKLKLSYMGHSNERSNGPASLLNIWPPLEQRLSRTFRILSLNVIVIVLFVD